MLFRSGAGPEVRIIAIKLLVAQGIGGAQRETAFGIIGGRGDAFLDVGGALGTVSLY